MTLVETMVSSALLGLGVLSLANMFFTSERGVAESTDRAAAHELAQQYAERLGAVSYDQLPACVVAGGCRLDEATYAPIKPVSGGYACSALVDGMTLQDPDPERQTGKYRIDTTRAAHPDPTQQQGAFLYTFSVCWTDGAGRVQEISVERMTFPEL